MAKTALPAQNAAHGSRLSGNLGPVAIVFMVIAAASPLTVIGGGAPLGIGLGNGSGFPALFIPIAVVLLLFAVGFTAMTRMVDKPGAFYTYIGYGLGRHAGAGGAWLAVLCYTSIQMAVYAYVGFLLSTTIHDVSGVSLPWWACSLGLIALVGVLGFRHIDLSSKVLGVLLVCEILVVAAITVAAVVTGGAEGLSLESFTPTAAIQGAPGIGMLFAIAAYIGFEATAIYRDEARDPDRTIPRATYGALIGVTVFYALGCWGIVIAWGPSKVAEVALTNPSLLLQATAGHFFGAAGPIVVNVLIITSMLACVLSFHNVLSRYFLSMSSAGLLPANLARVHLSHGSPYRASFVQTATAVIFISLFAVCGLDPVLHVFTWFSGVGTLAVVVLMLLTSIAAIVYFARQREKAAQLGRWRSAVAPALGGIGLVVFAIILAQNFPFLVGDMNASGQPAFGVLSIVLVSLCFLVFVFGLIQSELLRRSRPEAFRTMLQTIGETNV